MHIVLLFLPSTVHLQGNLKAISYVADFIFSTVNAALEAARDIKSPIIIQFSQGGAAYFAGKGLDNKNQEASILGAVAGAQVNKKINSHDIIYLLIITV